MECSKGGPWQGCPNEGRKALGGAHPPAPSLLPLAQLGCRQQSCLAFPRIGEEEGIRCRPGSGRSTVRQQQWHVPAILCRAAALQSPPPRTQLPQGSQGPRWEPHVCGWRGRGGPQFCWLPRDLLSSSTAANCPLSHPLSDCRLPLCPQAVLGGW